MTDSTIPQIQSRRTFIRHASLATIVLLGGRVLQLHAKDLHRFRGNIIFRIAVASDAHYGQANTSFDQMTDRIVTAINDLHSRQQPIDCCIINGDLIHNEPHFLPLVKSRIDHLSMPYYVTRGNHDMVTADYWYQVWKQPLNQDIVLKDHALILCDTSNEKGTYLSPDLAWLAGKLESHKQRKHVLLFLHIPQAKWTANGIDNPDFFTLVHKYANIKAVFHGHEHDQDGVKMSKDLPFFFDSHIGGSWGTTYKGFRVIELAEDGTLITYIMNPLARQNEMTYS